MMWLSFLPTSRRQAPTEIGLMPRDFSVSRACFSKGRIHVYDILESLPRSGTMVHSIIHCNQ